MIILLKMICEYCSNLYKIFRKGKCKIMSNDPVMIHEVLEAVGNQPSIKKKVQILKNMDCPALRHILKGAFDSNVKWLLPPGTPPNFKPDDAPAGLQFQSIHQQTPKFYLFVQAGVDSGKCPDLKKAKREQIFVQMLVGKMTLGQ